MVACYFFEKIPYGRKKCQAKTKLEFTEKFQGISRQKENA